MAVLWEPSAENDRIGDFTDFTDPRTYLIRIKGMGNSHPFVTRQTIYWEAAWVFATFHDFRLTPGGNLRIKDINVH